MERPCITCGGRCGVVCKRAPMDSNDFNEAHWVCGCALPPEEQMKIMKKAMSKKGDF